MINKNTHDTASPLREKILKIKWTSDYIIRGRATLSLICESSTRLTLRNSRETQHGFFTPKCTAIPSSADPRRSVQLNPTLSPQESLPAHQQLQARKPCHTSGNGFSPPRGDQASHYLKPLTIPTPDFFLERHKHIRFIYNTIMSSWCFLPTLDHVRAACGQPTSSWATPLNNCTPKLRSLWKIQMTSLAFGLSPLTPSLIPS